MSPSQKLRIVILFALRYQKSKANDIANLINLLLENGIPAEEAKVDKVFRVSFVANILPFAARLCYFEHRRV